MNDARMLGSYAELREALLTILALKCSVIGQRVNGKLSLVCLPTAPAK